MGAVIHESYSTLGPRVGLCSQPFWVDSGSGGTLLFCDKCVPKQRQAGRHLVLSPTLETYNHPKILQEAKEMGL